MKKRTPLLLGLIFALACNVSFAERPPGRDPKTEIKKENAFAVTAVTLVPVAIIAELYSVPVTETTALSQCFVSPVTTNFATNVAKLSDAFIFKSPPALLPSPDRQSVTNIPRCDKDEGFKPDKVAHLSDKNYKRYLYWQC